MYEDVRAPPDVVTSTDCPSRSGAKGNSGSPGAVGVMATDPADSLQGLGDAHERCHKWQ